MTVCIAAIAESGQHIVCATDTLITSGYTTYNPDQMKLFWLGDWTLLWSGTLATQTALEEAIVTNWDAKPVDEPSDVKDCLQRALNSELANFSTSKYLAPYCLSMEMFMKEKERFTPDMWDETFRKIFEYSNQYDPEMIVAGWGKAEQATERWQGSLPSLFLVNRDGVQNYHKAGFCTIGIGSDAAHSTMCFHNYNRQFSLSQAVYCVAASAFTAQRTNGVGEPGAIWVASREGREKGFFVQPSDLKKIRAEWERLSPSGVPESADRLVSEILARRT